MIAKHLEELVHYLLDLAGVPSQVGEGHPANDEGRRPAGEEEASLQPVPVKSFLHYL